LVPFLCKARYNAYTRRFLRQFVHAARSLSSIGVAPLGSTATVPATATIAPHAAVAEAAASHAAVAEAAAGANVRAASSEPIPTASANAESSISPRTAPVAPVRVLVLAGRRA
jgi:hypothetical protein